MSLFRRCAMDHFESIIKTLLEAEGYWVRQSFKVNLTKEEKRQIGKPSIPRPEIDLLALHFARNEVLAFEAKSFLDSPGVKLLIFRKIMKFQKDVTSSSRAHGIELLFSRDSLETWLLVAWRIPPRSCHSVSLQATSIRGKAQQFVSS